MDGMPLTSPWSHRAFFDGRGWHAYIRLTGSGLVLAGILPECLLRPDAQ